MVTAPTTLRDIARACGVSVSTVSRALANNPAIAEKTRAAIQAAAKELDYRPNAQARALKNSRTDAIGVVVPSLINPFFSAMTAAIEDEANKAGYATIITSSGESTPKITEAVEALRARQVDGIIAVPHAESVDMLELVARSTPLLFIDRYIPGCAIPAVISNSAPGIKAALKALASRGHKKVGYLAGPQTTSTGLERLKEFQRFSEDLGMEQVIHHGGYLYEEGFTGTQKLLEQQPTAIIAGDSMMTFGALEALYRHNVDIGKQIALVGFDDFVFMRIQPAPVAIIDQNVEEMGRIALRNLVASFAHESPPEGAVVQTRFIARESIEFSP
ncbi:MAG TPA: LacI family DNA-binding transcriptional regulator [Corynebacterium sp.]|nr:LacI family DNA-binding transcriptional regulator [Corynebacterium sp.]